MSARAAALARLRRHDEALAASHGPLRTLAPDRDRAHGAAEICDALFGEAEAPALMEAFADGAIAWREAIADAFPGNLLWDCDRPLAVWWRLASQDGDPVACATALLAQATALQHQFGRGTALSFRYAHDFLYGFDWAKWVTRAPADRSGIGPFDPAFLQSMRVRGDELLALLARGGDGRYRPLQRDQPRNPFSFSREPADELALHRALAVDAVIPVAAWAIDGNERWTRPFSQLRRDRAQELGLVPVDAIPRGA